MQLSELPLDTRLIKAIDKLGFKALTPVQVKAIPCALQGQDLMVSAETGSGKTAAYLLPILDAFLKKDARDTSTRGLILVPTRELARQIVKDIEKLACFTPIKAEMIIGGKEFKYQVSLFRQNPEIIVATPGRLLEHIERGSPDFADLEFLVLDEADRMLDMGFSEDVLQIEQACNRQRQTFLFSATLHHKGIAKMAQHVLSDPETIIINTVRDKHENIRQQIIPADNNGHKEQLVAWLLDNESYDKALIFTNTIVQAEKLGDMMEHQQQYASVLHGDLRQDERNEVMQWFRQGRITVLIATDLAARGLDIAGIDLVINFDMARSGDDYVHRIGRTGRAGNKGLAVSLISANEWNLMASIEHYLRQTFERRQIAELAGQFNGPKQLKSSGKAAGPKKKKKTQPAKPEPKKTKNRVRDQKQIGKRRVPTKQNQEIWKPLNKKDQSPSGGGE